MHKRCIWTAALKKISFPSDGKSLDSLLVFLQRNRTIYAHENEQIIKVLKPTILFYVTTVKQKIVSKKTASAMPAEKENDESNVEREAFRQHKKAVSLYF